MTKHLLQLSFITLSVTTLLFTAGCGKSKSKPASNSKPEPKELTYWQDVAPIMFEYCGTCHVDGGVAPFVLTNYESTKNWANFALDAMSERSMPPWLVTSDGSCGDFSHSRWLPADKIEVFKNWVDQDMKEGTPRTDLKVAVLPQLTNPTSFKTPNFTPIVEGGLLAEYDEYRCFLVDPKLGVDKFVTGYDVIPGTPPLIHHVLVFSVDPNAQSDMGNTNAEQIEILKSQSPDRDGWSCFGRAGEGVDIKGIPVTWAPGQGAVNYPDDTGFRLAKEDKLVVQVHYNLANSSLVGKSDQTEVKIRYEDSVKREGQFLLTDLFLTSLYDPEPKSLEPGLKDAKFSWQENIGRYTAAAPSKKLDMYGAFPHMHERGRKMSVTLQHPDGSQKCLADVQNWDFEWQLYYFYKTPVEINEGDILKTTCTYDTSGDTSPVLPGWGTHNEMCLFGTFIVPK